MISNMNDENKWFDSDSLLIRLSTSDSIQHWHDADDQYESFSYQEWQYNVSGILNKSTDISGVINAEYEC